MGKIFFNAGTSLDGFIAGPNGGPTNPLGDGGTEIHKWIYNQQSFIEPYGGEGGETGKDNDLIIELNSRPGANIMGKRMFDEGEFNWPEDAPFHSPVFVLTHEKREPWERLGGTTFYFINDGFESALELARKSAGNKDIRIAGGANVIQQAINAGLIDEFYIHSTPVMLGDGVRLFENIDVHKLDADVIEVIPSSLVTHLKYKVKK